MGAVHKSVTFRCMFMLVQLNNCVVCGSNLKRGHSGDRCLSSSILFKYECSMGQSIGAVFTTGCPSWRQLHAYCIYINKTTIISGTGKQNHIDINMQQSNQIIYI